MGIPTLLHPTHVPKSGDKVQNKGKHLLLGTESDPHYINSSQSVFTPLDSFQPKDKEQESSRNHTKPGKLRMRANWKADGSAFHEIDVNKVKLFLRPNWFFQILHFFTYGLPEFDPLSEDLPNEFEANIEKDPRLEIKVTVLDSMVCMDSFDLCEIEKQRKVDRLSNVDSRRSKQPL